jgi:magnesium chelatase family protein
VVDARERQAARLRQEGVLCNAQMDARMLHRYVKLDRRGESMLTCWRERGLLSMRGQHRTLRVARTIADLKGSEQVDTEHLACALSLRAETGLAGRRVA